MSLNINMKNVNLVKGKDGWIYISEDGTIEKGTKLLYDDGEKPEIRSGDKDNGIPAIYASDKKSYYEYMLRNIANKNSWDRLYDLAMLIDFALTLKGSQSMSLKEFL